MLGLRRAKSLAGVLVVLMLDPRPLGPSRLSLPRPRLST